MKTVMEMFDLTGKVALITGAGGLLGPKHAEAILECGGGVVLTDVHDDRVLWKADQLREKFPNSNISSFRMDVTDKNNVLDIVGKIPKIDILINNAAKDPKVKKDGGLTPDSRFETMTEEYWSEGIDAAINGTFICSQAVANKMLKQGGGVILNISSEKFRQLC